MWALGDRAPPVRYAVAGFLSQQLYKVSPPADRREPRWCDQSASALGRGRPQRGRLQCLRLSAQRPGTCAEHGGRGSRLWQRGAGPAVPLPTAIPSPSLCPCGENDKVRGAGAWEAAGPFRRDPALPSPSPGADAPCPWALSWPQTSSTGSRGGRREGND